MYSTLYLTKEIFFLLSFRSFLPFFHLFLISIFPLLSATKTWIELKENSNFSSELQCKVQDKQNNITSSILVVSWMALASFLHLFYHLFYAWLFKLPRCLSEKSWLVWILLVFKFTPPSFSNQIFFKKPWISTNPIKFLACYFLCALPCKYLLLPG